MLSDVRYGLRRWRARPLFAVCASATIALAIGTATALFSLVDGVLLKPLPFPDADRLVVINRTSPNWLNDPILARSWNRISLSFPEYFFLRDKARTIEGLAVRTTYLGQLPPSADSGARELTVAVISSGYLPLFGVQPLAGRFFSPDDDRDDRRVVLLGEGLWRARFGADPAVVGRTLRLADGGRTLLGIVPASFRLPSWKADVWEPLGAIPPDNRADNNRSLDAVARLRDGVSRGDAEAEMDGLLRQIFRFKTPTGGAVTSLVERMIAPVRTPLSILLAGALLLLALACANVAGFLVGDAASRGQEMRVRSALGAATGRLVRQLVVESTLLAEAGAAGGLLVAAWGVQALIALAPASVPRLTQVGLDGRALIFALAATAAAALLAGTVPALVMSRGAALSSALRVTAHRRAQGRLLVVQLAIGITLLAGAALFVRTLENLNHVEIGFARDHLVVARASLPQPLYSSNAQYGQYFARAVDAVAKLPGVSAAAVSTGPPFATGGGASTSIQLGPDAAGGAREAEAQRRYVSPDYFRVMEMPILAGRGFTTSDSREGDVFVVVSREMAQRFWRGDAIGRVFTQGSTRFRVIGMTGDVRDLALSSNPKATFYISIVQRSPWYVMRIVARTVLPPASMAASVRKALAAVDPAVPIEDVTTMEQLIATSVDEQRYRAVLLSTMASVAAILAALGLYGAMARAVAERRREIGVRVALGARPGQVTRLFLTEAGRIAAVAAALGLAGAIEAGRVMSSLLFGVGPLDGGTLAAVAVAAVAIAIAGGYFPARRASRGDPAAILR